MPCEPGFDRANFSCFWAEGIPTNVLPCKRWLSVDVCSRHLLWLLIVCFVLGMQL